MPHLFEARCLTQVGSILFSLALKSAHYLDVLYHILIFTLHLNLRNNKRISALGH